GRFDAAIDRLDHLVHLGVDPVDLLPVNAFNGEQNWGYDRVCWFAQHEPYGGPDGLKRFVDACHAGGLGVVLDAVDNHLGPAGARGTTSTWVRWSAWPTCCRRSCSTRVRGPRSAAGRTAGGWTSSAFPATASSPTCRTTTRSATGPPATGSPTSSPTTSSRS